MSFQLNPKQLEANRLLASPAQHILLYGGSRSGKTFLICRAIAVRSLKAPGARHAILRFRLSHVKTSIVHDTWPKMMRLCFPQAKGELNKADLFYQFENGSEVWFGGLDDKERTEKILGSEYAGIFLNECSQIPWNSRNVAVTRLAQLVHQDERIGKPLPLKLYYDENPPDKGHWTYKLFKGHQDPETKRPQPDPENYACLQLNPVDNEANLGADYIKTLQGLSARMRKRFLEGEFREAAPNALFTDEIFEKWRVVDLTDLPEMLRIAVGVDPSGAEDENNTDNDEIGIIVGGLGIDGKGYVLADLTCKAGPATWGRVAVDAFVRERADRVVGEVNFGGAMVGYVIRSEAMKQKAVVPFQALTASRGKVVRAEPVSSLMETGDIRLAGLFPALEEECCGFTTYGFVGDHSPNRADAMIWVMSALFPQLLMGKEEKLSEDEAVNLPQRARNDGLGWMSM